MDQGLEEFLKAWNTVAAQTPPPRPLEYRVYYNPTTGEILHYTNDPLEGEYIIVDKDFFEKCRFDWRIKNGKPVAPQPKISKLQPSQDGTACNPSDITIVARPGEPAQHWKLHNYEQD